MTTRNSKQHEPQSRQRRHADQESLVRHLSAVMRDRLAGRDETGMLILDREPDEQVTLGVITPRREPRPVDEHPDLATEPGVPIDTQPSSEMGLTLLVKPTSEDSEVEVRCSFALYIQQFPTYQEQYEYVWGPDGQHGDKTPERTGNVRVRSVFRRYPVDVVTRFQLPAAGGYEPDSEAVTAAIQRVFAEALANDRLYLPLKGRGQTIPQSVIASGSDAYETHLAEKSGDLTEILQPLAEISVTTEAAEGGALRLNITLANMSEEADSIRGYRPSLSLYDASISATFSEVSILNSGFRFAEEDYRIAPEVYAHGRFCVGEADLANNRVWTTTWPTYRQPVFESRTDLQPTFSELSTDPVPVLSKILREMEGYEVEWRQFLGGDISETARKASELGLDSFTDEMHRFRTGLGLIDPKSPDYVDALAQSFRLMNEAFETLNAKDAGPGGTRIQSWYLFQIVFIVCGLASLAGREAPPDSPLLEEFNVADVLWFPTGGGKSEAFLGLVATALFFDRLRGKQLGVTSVIRFPLRMLSVQQLDRVMNVIVACEEVRARQLGTDTGTSFELGYFVGRQNTPNKLTNAQDEKWGDLHRMKSKSDADPNWGGERTVITRCPYCRSEDVTLTPDIAAVRLHHICLSCERRIPVVVSDDEIYRTLPSVVVATVDKLATIAFNAHFSHLTHGPRAQCPDHGFVTYPAGFKGEKRCIARNFCDRDPSEWTVLHNVYDPAPSLVVQDELHLLSEELGTFSSHYETLWSHLTSIPTGRPSKVITATATISDYEHHVRHLYALRPRRFPSEGFEKGRSFYAEERPELARRLFVGSLPGRYRPTQMAVAAAQAYREELKRLQALPPGEIESLLGLEYYTSSDIPELLSRYDLQLFYVNRKTDGDRVGEDLERLGPQIGDPPLDVEVLNGQTALSHISAVIRRTQEEGRHTPPHERLAAVVGTSLISHGIDIGRVNVLHVAGMTSTIAYYVQATARAGRSDVGLVLVGFSRSFARDRAVYHFFDPHHRYVNQLVEPVSINRFSLQSPRKTASGMMSALILHEIGRNPLCVPSGDSNLSVMDNFRKCVIAHQSTRSHHNGMAFKEFLRSQLHAAYGLNSQELDPLIAARFREVVDRQFDAEWVEIDPGRGRMLTKSFSQPPMSSFRDIDDPVEFGAFGPYSRNRFELLSRGRSPKERPNVEVVPAEESGETDGT